MLGIEIDIKMGAMEGNEGHQILDSAHNFYYYRHYPLWILTESIHILVPTFRNYTHGIVPYIVHYLNRDLH